MSDLTNDIFGIRVVVFISVCGAFAPFIYPPLHNLIANAHEGDALGVSGVSLAIGGFFIAIWQSLRTRSAANAATNAVSTVILQVRQQNSTILRTSILKSVEELDRLQLIWTKDESMYSLALMTELMRRLHIELVEHRATASDTLSRDDEIRIQGIVSELEVSRKLLRKWITQRNVGVDVHRRRKPNLLRLFDLLAQLPESLGSYSAVLSSPREE